MVVNFSRGQLTKMTLVSLAACLSKTSSSNHVDGIQWPEFENSSWVRLTFLEHGLENWRILGVAIKIWVTSWCWWQFLDFGGKPIGYLRSPTFKRYHQPLEHITNMDQPLIASKYWRNYVGDWFVSLFQGFMLVTDSKYWCHHPY